MAQPPRSTKGRKPTTRGTNARQKSPARGRKALAIEKPQPITITPPQTKAAASLTVAAGASPAVQTIVYIHGIGNKPLASVLKCQWDDALFGVQLGDRSRMAYWVNRDYYPLPSNDTCTDGDVVKIDDDEVTTKTIMALAAKTPTNEQDAIDAEIKALTTNEAQRDWLQAVAYDMTARGLLQDGAIPAPIMRTADVRAKFLPLPVPLRRLVTQKLTRAFLRDVNDFFFHPDRRQDMEQSLVDRLNAGGGPFIVIAHSQGSMIAYNVLRHLTKAECDVRLLVTIGSPLGLTEVKDVFHTWTDGDLGIPPCVTQWVNVAEWLDPVAADHNLQDDFTPANTIENFSGLLLNPDAPRHPHSGTGYLRSEPVQTMVRQTAGNAFAQAVAKAIIVKDLVEDLENSFPKERHTTLIQLSTSPEAGPLGQTLVHIGERVEHTIRDMVRAGGDDVEEAEIDVLKRFISARLTRFELERLRTQYKDLMIEKIWRDATKKALIHQSSNTIQVRPANLGYNAVGSNIGWAVLDTGIRADHPHFQAYQNIVRQWDCTQPGQAVEVKGQESTALDNNGHGTHVAGIIAGRYTFSQPGRPEVVFAGMAPETRLYGFKVLKDNGNGQDSYIIKALDCIAALNEEAGRLVIHGVNLSLGGAFDPSVYGCGHTPLCQELRRLWNQGVLVCLAAGNEGYALLQALEGKVPANMDLSIGDPANLDEAIAVGSIHKVNPHTFGISYFSSRGPTADGRRKPDVVAPGEQILSAYHAYNHTQPEQKRTIEDLYVEMSGTSMAAPHVAGLLAAFLSVRREFIGYPNQVKKILLENCTDLNRDVYIQGYGMPNLIKMLANS